MDSYKILYDIQKDIWNWRDALKSSFMGSDWLNNIDNNSDRKIAQQILGLKKQPAELILKPYLIAQKENPNSKLNKFIEIIENDFQEKYQNACQILEKITKHPMISDNFTFYVTTFPRGCYFYEKCEIFMYDSIENFWGMPIDGFLHEGLHFQFTCYWREDKNSPISKLNDDNFDYIKEALTVVLDDDLKPIITTADQGYSNQIKYRKLLSKHWQKYHDFEKLVDYGLSKLNNFTK